MNWITLKAQTAKWWEFATGSVGIIGTIAVERWNQWVAFLIGVVTLAILTPRAIIWWIRLIKEWRNRNSKPESHDPE